MADKDHLNLIITGHIDNGKSTTMGHFLMDLGIVDERTIAAHAKESEETGKGDSFKYAWVMDCLLYTSPSPRDGLLSRMPSSA